jgi:hypothetical protein
VKKSVYRSIDSSLTEDDIVMLAPRPTTLNDDLAAEENSEEVSDKQEKT